MDVNLPVWGYYQKGFVDPLYVPYQKQKVPIGLKNPEDGKSCYINVNPFAAVAGNNPAFVNPALQRKGWGLSFQRKHDNYPCPTGFVPGDEGWCFPESREAEQVFYTDKAFIPSYQFHAPRFVPKRGFAISETWSTPAERPNSYARLPARHSYISGLT